MDDMLQMALQLIQQAEAKKQSQQTSKSLAPIPSALPPPRLIPFPNPVQGPTLVKKGASNVVVYDLLMLPLHVGFVQFVGFTRGMTDLVSVIIDRVNIYDKPWELHIGTISSPRRIEPWWSWKIINEISFKYTNTDLTNHSNVVRCEGFMVKESDLPALYQYFGGSSSLAASSS